jgi:hypothetical protein
LEWLSPEKEEYRMIPSPNAAGELPPGVHIATTEEVEAMFVTTPRRRLLFDGLRRALQNLQTAGVRRVFIDGSFVTTKAEPNDVDGCWEWNDDVNLDLMDPVFLDFSDQRQAMKDTYGVDFFLATWMEAGPGLTFLEFFQRNRSDEPKGIVRLDLGEPS